MTQTPDIQTLLFRAQLLLEEGQSDRALSVLEIISTDYAEPQLTEKRQEELKYLLGWCYTERKRWDDALRVLAPLANLAKEDEEDEESFLDRKRLAQCLLRLGQVAVNMARYEDASRHYTKCRKVLQDKRLHLPLGRVTACYGLAMTYTMRGLYASAIQYYTEAIRLCLYIDDDDEIGNIYYGLSDTYRRAGNYADAQLAGKKALELYERSGNQLMEGVTHNLLGNISYSLDDYREASDHFTEAMAIATSANSTRMVMVNCTALARLRLKEGRLEEAKRYCHRALDITERLAQKDEQLTGLTYRICGQVAHAEAERAGDEEQKRRLLKEAVKMFEASRDRFATTQAYADLAELYGYLAEVLEELGQTGQAIACWKSGYEALASATGPAWY